MTATNFAALVDDLRARASDHLATNPTAAAELEQAAEDLARVVTIARVQLREGRDARTADQSHRGDPLTGTVSYRLAHRLLTGGAR